MGEFDDLFQPNDKLEGNPGGYSWSDADTLRDADGALLRLEGYEAAETAKQKDGVILSSGTAGGAAATRNTKELAAKYGFNIVEYLKNPDGSPKMDATGSRQMIRLKDKHGRDFTEALSKHGINEVSQYSTDQEVLAAELGAAERASNLDAPLTDWEKAELDIKQATQREMRWEQQFKRTALNEAELAALNAPQAFGESDEAYRQRKARAKQFVEGQVQIRHLDRDIDNKSLNPLSEGFDVGLTGVQESMYGVVELLGEKTGNNWLEDIGEGGIARARSYLADKPELKLSAVRRNKDGDLEWDIDNVGEFFEFLGTNAAVSLPYMAGTIGATVAAPFTGGASYLAPVAIYTGQTWNEMEGENRSASLAIGAGVLQAALDKFGLDVITGTGGKLLMKETLDAATANLVRQGIPRADAMTLISNATRKEIANFAGSAADVAKQQITSRNILRATASAAGKGLLGEAVTEAGQELTAYTAAVAGSDKEWDANELIERLANAAIAGGTIGAGFSIPGVGYDAGAWADVAVRQAPAEAARRSRAGNWAQHEVDNFGRAKSIQELNVETGRAVASRGTPATTFDDKVEAAKNRRGASTVFGHAKEAWASVPGLWQGATRFIFKPEWQDKSRALRILADTFGGNLQRTFSGVNFENRKHHLLTEYKNLVSTPANYAQAAGFKRADTTALSEIAYKLREIQDPQTGEINWDQLPEDLQQHRTWLSQLSRELRQLGDKLHGDQAQYNPELGYLNNYLLRYKSFNKAAIEKNRNGFIQALQDQYAYTRADAEALANAIVDSDFLTGEADFHVGAGRHIPGSHRSRDLNLADNPYFDEFMEKDLFNNISNAAKSASRYVTYQEFLGDNNEKINHLFDQAIQEGVPTEVVNEMARQMQDYLDAESGNYKRIQNQTWNNIQKNLMFWTTIAGLPLATLSSFVELAITTRALNKDQVGTIIGEQAKQLASGIFDAIKSFRPQDVAKTGTTTAGQLAKEARQQTIKDLGYFNWDTSAGATIGATEFHHMKQKWLDKYFKLIQLQQWTDYTRNVRGSMAGDFIFNHLETIKAGREQNVYNNEVLEAEEHLRNLGLNIEDMLNLDQITRTRNLTEEEAAQFERNMNDATFNFINEAVALPQVANRPLFYQNPHLALFTQFQGFIATFTANHIPRMWGEYVKRGTPAMKYNAFAVMATMLLLGAVSQHLKDLLKYGEPSPYLEDTEKLQRALNSSGLIGTFERPLGFLFPLYESSSNNPAEWFFNTLSGEAAALSNVSRAAGGAGKIIEGNTEKGVYDLLKTAPLIGPLNQFNRTIASFFE